MKQHLFAFYRLDKALIYQYYDIYEQVLKDNEPNVYKHLSKNSVHPHLYLFNWFQTLYVKVLPLDIASRIWDCFLVDGTLYIVKVAIAIVAIFKRRILSSNFEEAIQLLSLSPGQDKLWNANITIDRLFPAIESVKISSKSKLILEDITDRTYY